MDTSIRELAQKLASAYSTLPQVKAVGLAGSRAGFSEPDSLSDIDLYVYKDGEIPISARRQLVPKNSIEIELGNRFWEEGDEWFVQDPPVKVDVMFRDRAWIEDEVARVMDRHEARLGYSTCFLYNVQTCLVLYDRDHWLGGLKARASRAYPSALRDAILAKNHPVLRDSHSAYSRQIASAAARKDYVSLNHRVAALLASYFDIVIAVNLLAHPGEKRLARFVEEHCPLKPENLAGNTAHLLEAVPQGDAEIVEKVKVLLDELDAWLGRLGLLPTWPRQADI